VDRRGGGPDEDQTWNGLVPLVQAAVAAAVPAEVPVLVVADGFGPLLDHAGRRSGNFPQDGLGQPVHHRLPDGRRTSWHLEALRAKGFGALVFPSTAFWWFDHYASLRAHLDSRSTIVWDDESCRIYDIGERRPEGPDPRLDTWLSVFEAGAGRLPSVLDWATGAHLAARLADAPVVEVGAVTAVDYLDQSLDLVVVREDAGPEVLAEARRVATSAVATLTGRGGEPRLRLVWRSPHGVAPPRAVLVVDLADADAGDSAAHLRAVTDAVPPGLVAGIVALTDVDLPVPLDERVEVRRRPDDGLRGLLAVAQATDAEVEVVVLLQAGALPVEGCVAALLRTLVVDADVVAVCGCVVDPIGLLRSAGAALLAGGDVVPFGPAGADPCLPRSSYVRPVTVCPPPLVALRTEALGPGPDLRGLESAEGQHAALSCALREHGGRLAYQPEALVVDLDPGPAGRPVPPADRAVLQARWPVLVAAAPGGPEGLSWYDLAAAALA
jgi:hypothetical protein